MTATTATASGVLNPKATGEAGVWFFLYGASAPGACGEEAILPSPFGTAVGKKEEVVMEVLTGLHPHTQYTACLLERNTAESEQAESVPVAFETLLAAPEIEGESATPKGEEATLGATIEPNNEKTKYVFEYAMTAAAIGTVGATKVPGAAELENFGGQAVNVETGASTLTPHTTYYYRVTAENAKGEKAKPGKVEDFITGPLEAPEAGKLEANPVGKTTATLHGVLNPAGAVNPDSYEFRYNASATTCEGEGGASSAGSALGGEQEAVAASIENLLPGATYSYCLHESNEAGEEVISAPVKFTTLSVAPKIAENSASEVTATSAELNAEIDPGGGATTYHFEYDTTPYTTSAPHGTSTPESGSIGSDNKEHPALASVGGLQPNTTYHYRVVVHNAAGGGAGSTVDGPDATFTTQVASGEFTLPDNRVWEQVSPVNKHGARIEAITKEGGIISAAQEGGAMTYVANAPLEEPAGNRGLAFSQIISLRGHDGGWSTRDLAPPYLTQPEGLVVGELDEYFAFSPTLSRAVLEPHVSPPLSPQLAKENSVLFREDLLEPALGPVYNPLADNQNTPPGTHYGVNALGNPTVRYVAASGNLEHIILESTTQLTNTPGSGLYEWSNDTLTPISILPNEEFISQFNAKLGDYSTNVRNAVSENGNLVFWSTLTGGSSHLYVREVPEERTIQIDLPAKDVPAPSSEPEPFFEYATPDGERVYFKDGQRLTANSTAERHSPELYEYNTSSGELTDLTPNPAGPGPNNENPSSNVWGEVIGASDNGEYVYLVSKSALNGETAPAIPGRTPEEEAAREYKLYEIHNINGTHTPTLITTLTSQDRHDWEYEEGPALERILEGLTSRMSPDGQFLAFMSDLPLTGYDNVDADERPTMQEEEGGVGAATKVRRHDEEVFEYDAATNKTVCVSCNPSGARPHGVFDPGSDDGHSSEGIGLLVDRQTLWEGRWLAGSVPGWTTRKLKDADYQSRYLSDEGRLFFDSPDALVPEDSNGKEDVYQYEPAGAGTCAEGASSGSDVFVSGAGGCVGLISAGTSSKESAFLDASETGDDVFFLTASPLSSADLDDADDVYDAHVCTQAAPCSGATLASPPCTTEASCKAAPVPQPAIFGSGPTETLAGSGNPAPAAAAAKPKAKAKPVRCKRGFVRKKNKCLRKKVGKKAGKSNRKGRK